MYRNALKSKASEQALQKEYNIEYIISGQIYSKILLVIHVKSF